MAKASERVKEEIAAELAAAESQTSAETTAPAETAAPEPEKMVTIILPITREEKGDVFFSVNDRSWLIKRGVPVEVPACVAEVIRNQERAMRKAIDFAQAAEMAE